MPPVTDTPKQRVPSRKQLEALAKALEEIAGYFGWAQTDFSDVPTQEHTAADARIGGREEREEEVESDEDGNEVRRPIAKEEVEVAIDSFTSSLIESQVIHERKSAKPPSFAGVFTKLFGCGEIVELAEKFESDVEGYMEWIGPDEMEGAERQFLRIREIVIEHLRGVANAK